MAVQVQTNDSAALTDADLDELASMGGAFGIGELSKAKEDWVLVTAARTQLDESAEYAPLRMLAAAGRLAGFIAERATPETRAFLAGPLQHMPDAAFRTADPARYAADLDLVCRAVADHLVRHFGLDPDAT